jgi:uncharacterized protein (DUF1800 family)
MGGTAMRISVAQWAGGLILIALLGANAAAATAVIDAPQSDAEAARFLTMATFGPTAADIKYLRTIGYSHWFAEQLAMPATLQRPYVENLDADVKTPGQRDRIAIWFNNAITAPDQLRQRAAWALSQIFVVSDQGNKLNGDPVALAEFYDTLARDAFGYHDAAGTYHAGTYSNLLIDVTYSPAMGKMLTYLRNDGQPSDPGVSPDENYGREIMQLFSIGLIERNADFSPQLNDGQTIATYASPVVQANARVFTGLSYNPVYSNGFFSKFVSGPKWTIADYLPMYCYENHHDEGSKTVVDGAVIGNPAPSCDQIGAGSKGDIKQLLGILAGHHNVAPFISRQLIQRFTSSNPSPQYIQRVVAVFMDNGHGVYGDLGAVIKAVLTDAEAVGAAAPAPYAYGKAREPLLKLTALWRYYGAAAHTGIYALGNMTASYGQSPLDSPSVFNFYLPDYYPPGELADAGLFGPEFQISGESNVVATANDLTNRANTYQGRSSNNHNTIAIDISSLVALAATPSLLVSRLNHDLMYGSMSAGMNATLTNMVTNVSIDPTTRVTSALQVLLASPEFSIQK